MPLVPRALKVCRSTHSRRQVERVLACRKLSDLIETRAVTDDFEMQEVPRESAASGGGGVRKNFTLGVTEVSVQLVENDGAAAGSLADPLAKPAVEGRDEVPQA